jgi:hypothetical protein
MVTDQANDSMELVADVPIEEVRATPDGFVMQGLGADRAEYRLEMHLDWPVDQRTKKVLGEILAQAEVRVMRWRTAPARPRRTARGA